jgi:hypothetical protein
VLNECNFLKQKNISNATRHASRQPYASTNSRSKPSPATSASIDKPSDNLSFLSIIDNYKKLLTIYWTKSVAKNLCSTSKYALPTEP